MLEIFLNRVCKNGCLGGNLWDSHVWISVEYSRVIMYGNERKKVFKVIDTQAPYLIFSLWSDFLYKVLWSNYHKKNASLDHYSKNYSSYITVFVKTCIYSTGPACSVGSWLLLRSLVVQVMWGLHGNDSWRQQAFRRIQEPVLRKTTLLFFLVKRAGNESVEVVLPSKRIE